MATLQSSSRRRKLLAVTQLRQGQENRRYKKDPYTGIAPKRGVPVDLRPDLVKLNALNRYIGLSQR